MKNVTTMATARVAAVATGLAMATSMLSFAPMVHATALTSAQVSAIVSLLSSFGADSATIANVSASLTGTAVTSGSTTTTTSSYAFTRDLTVGSTGADVTALQNALIAKGMMTGTATGYFGAITKAAVIKWQTAASVTPAAGYFGSISRAAFSAAASTSTNTTTTTTTTTGTTVTTAALTGSGRLTNVVSIGDVTSDIKEGDSATQVIGVSADATGGDVSIQRVDTTLTIGGTTGSANLDRYVSDVSLYLDGKKLASMDPATGDKSGRVWTLRFSGLNGVIKSGQTGSLYVKVTPLSTIGSSEASVTVTAALATDSIRAVAADGISDTYGATVTQGFTVTATTGGTLTVSAGNDNPVASQWAVSSSTTSGKTLLTFNLKAKNSAITITDLPVQLGTTDNSLGDVISTVKLMKGSTVLSSKTVGTGTFGTTTFTGINQTIAKDATVSYSIVVDVKGDSAYADGITLVASTTVYGWDVADADGATVTPSAAVAGNAQTLTAAGIAVVMGTPTASVASANYSTGLDVASFTIPFTVTAGDNDVFIAGSAAKGANASGKIAYATTTTSTTGKTQEPVASIGVVGTAVTGDLAGSYFKVLANTSRSFNFNGSVTASTSATAASAVGLVFNGIAYGATNSTMTSYYTSSIDTFKTADVWVMVH